MFGIKFLIEVDGQARKFSLIPLLLNVGSGLALMGLVSSLQLYSFLVSKHVFSSKTNVGYHQTSNSKAFFSNDRLPLFVISWCCIV